MIGAKGNQVVSSRNRNAGQSLHRGLTLVELLAVIGVITVVAAVTLPSVRSILADRQTQQAALQVRSFIEAARSRAIGRDREVAVVLERMRWGSGDQFGQGPDDFASRNTVLSLSLAEVLPPYRGDIEGALATIQAPLVPGRSRVALQLADVAASVIAPGDEISLGDSRYRFQITEVQDTGAIRTLTFFNGDGETPLRPAVRLPAAGARVPFRIYSRPRRLFAKPVTLPRSTCIDLALSGLGSGGAQFGSLSSGAARSYPIYLVFNTSGGLSHLYVESPAGLVRSVPDGDVFLMVGRTEQVSSGQTLGDFRSAQDESARFRPNMLDNSAYWVRVAADSGQLATSPVVPLPAELDASTPLAQLLGTSRRRSILSTEVSSR